MSIGAKERGRLAILAAILLVGLGLRLLRLDGGSLWYDETVSVHLASSSPAAMVAHTAGDIHPPGYYLLLHGWRQLAGTGDFAARFFSLFFGLLLVALAYRLGRAVFGAEAGLLAALLTAVSPFHLWYSQEVRMYTLAAVLGMALLWLVARWLSAGRDRLPPWTELALYALGAALGLWVLYYFAFLLMALNALVAIWWLAVRRPDRAARRWLGRWALAQGAALVLFSPWLPIAWRQVTQPPVPPWRSFTGFGDLLLQSASALSLGQSVDPQRAWPWLILFGVLVSLGLLARQMAPRLRGRLPGDGLPWLLGGYVALPVLLIYGASLVTPLYHPRYLFPYSPPFYVLLGAGLAWLGRRWRPLAWAALAMVLILSGISARAYYADSRYARDDHRAAVDFLAERWRPGDAILVNAGYAYPALLTYWDGDPIAWQGRLGEYGGGTGPGPVVVQTGTVDGDPALGWGDPDADFYALSRAETEAALGRLFADFDRVWVYRIYDTVVDPQGWIRAWLEGQGVLFEEQVFGGESQLRVQGYLTGRDPMADGGRALEATLSDGSLRALAVSGGQGSVRPGQALDLALVWQVSAPPRADAILFAGLFDEEGGRWAQTDERPLGPRLPPGAWQADSTVRTPLRVMVPATTPPGRYRLEVGWYYFDQGQPLWMPWTTGDRLVVGEVEVLPPERGQAVPAPEVSMEVDITIGEGVRLVGMTTERLEGRSGETLAVDLFWQALQNHPPPGEPVLQLLDGAGQVVGEWASAPVSGRAPLASLQDGQVVRDPRRIDLPGGLTPGVYELQVGRRLPTGEWLPIRRGWVGLGETHPLATVRVLGR